MARTLAEVIRTPVLLLTEADIAMLDPVGQAWARQAQANHARELACPGHKRVSTATQDERNRGDHRAKCRHCGMDMSRDSGG